MKLLVATNWDTDLIETLSPFPVAELFGALAETPVGGGRPSSVLAHTTREEAADYVRAVHDKGWDFNYLLNAPCMGNMEYDKETHRDLLKHLEWLCEIGVDTVTVSIPYLLEIIKRQFPELKVKVSVIADVGSVARARFYEQLGADEITVDYMKNRDFAFLRRVRESVSCDLTLLVNDMCLYQCPFRTYHYNACGHASQAWHPTGGLFVDYCIVSCTLQKLEEPAQMLSCRWIRPEDLSRYEALGYEKFKISGRRMPTSWLTRVTEAYAQQRFDGNLIDILMVQIPAKPYIDNRALDGFLDHFEAQGCKDDCPDCGYCATFAERAVRCDGKEIQWYITALKNIKNDLASSHVILEDRERRMPQTIAATDEQSASEQTSTVQWNPKTREEFEQIISFVPRAFRALANRFVAQASEDIARERGSLVVERADIVKAFLRHTPKGNRKNMLKGLRSIGIDPDQY